MFEDTQKIIEIIEKEYEKICDEQNTHIALDFICEIIEQLTKKYKID